MFQIDNMSRKPVYEQIVDQLEQLVITDVLPAGSKVPSVRSLSIELSINPNTIQKSYSELDRRGIIYSVPGRGCFVSDNAKEILSSMKRKKITDLELLMRELALVGVKRQEMEDCINRVFDNKEEAEQ